jgi:metallo-beta-lactamase family protein
MAIRLTFHGAAGEVTGSAYHVQTDRASVLVDFGMFQGGEKEEERNRLPKGMKARELDAVLLTHGHLDHVGRLPLLARQGYSNPVYCTPATIDITRLILEDAAKIQAGDLIRENRKRQRSGQPELEPSFTHEDVQKIMSLCRPVPYDTPVEVAPGVRASFVEAGHLLGSASIRVCAQNGSASKCIAFSGDLGPSGAPILKDAEGFAQADAVVLESTYGDRDHKSLEATISEFEAIVREAVQNRVKLMVPTFAVGRAQLLMYLLAIMFRRGTVPKFPVFLDSPMAIEATRIYMEHPELYDEDLRALRAEHPIREDMNTLHLSLTADDSKAINNQEGPCMILAGAGMCTAGRILHHLKQNLWKSNAAVLIVGFQSENSLGRRLVDGVKEVTIFGEKIVVRARVNTLGGFSAHAGQTDLLNWFRPLAAGRPRVILTHGESRGRDALAAKIRERHGLDCDEPMLGETLEL